MSKGCKVAPWETAVVWTGAVWGHGLAADMRWCPLDG